MNKLSKVPTNPVQDTSSNKQPFIQPRLIVNRPNDPYEREADAMADSIMNLPMPGHIPLFAPKPAAPSVQRKCAQCEGKEHRRLPRNKHAGASRTTSVTGADPRTSPPTPDAATAVSGITINFAWVEGTARGKGVLNSINEQTLSGTWGIGASTTSGGTWQLAR